MEVHDLGVFWVSNASNQCILVQACYKVHLMRLGGSVLFYAVCN